GEFVVNNRVSMGHAVPDCRHKWLNKRRKFAFLVVRDTSQDSALLAGSFATRDKVGNLSQSLRDEALVESLVRPAQASKQFLVVFLGPLFWPQHILRRLCPANCSLRRQGERRRSRSPGR